MNTFLIYKKFKKKLAITYSKKMDSVDFLLNEDFWSLLIDKSLYQNEMIEKKISDFIESKAEIQ